MDKIKSIETEIDFYKTVINMSLVVTIAFLVASINLDLLFYPAVVSFIVFFFLTFFLYIPKYKELKAKLNR